MHTIPTSCPAFLERRFGNAALSTVICVACTLSAPRVSMAGDEPDSSVALRSETRIEFADPMTARRVLGNRDQFVQQLSPLERQLRLQAAAPVSERQFLEFVQLQTLAWSQDERQQLTKVFAELQPLLRDLKPGWPKQIQLILTTGREESGAPHCREAAIVLPRAVIQRSPTALKRLLLHELFHILSSHSPESRKSLYAIIGFRQVEPIALPASIASRKITNPDAPCVDCVIEIADNGKQITATPILLTKQPSYESMTSRTLFGELLFQLMQVEESDGTWQAVLKDGEPILIQPRNQKSYHAQGRNTAYVIHPEEVLADNFVQMVLDDRNLPDPWIVERMRRVLTDPVRE